MSHSKTSSGPEQRRTRERIARRDLILKAGAHVFSRYGYEQATMVQVAREAELGKASLYYYFKTKQELFAEILSRAAEDMADGFLSALSLEELGTGTSSIEATEVLGGLETMLRFSLVYFRAHEELLGLFLPLVVRGPDRLRELVGDEVASKVTQAHAPIWTRLHPAIVERRGGEDATAVITSFILGLATKMLHGGGEHLDAEVDMFMDIMRRAWWATTDTQQAR